MAHPLAGGDPVRQARHHLGLHHGVHADRRRARPPRRSSAGPASLWFTQIIYQWFNTGQNWARGAAYAVVLLVTCIVFVLLMMRVFKVKMGEIGK